jgi:hypothetical protein
MDGSIVARYSTDGARTWSTTVILVSQGARAGVSTDHPGGAYVDPTTGKVTLVFFSVTGFDPNDVLNPASTLCEIYVVQSTGYSSGRPVMGTPVKLSGLTMASSAAINYALTYTGPIRTSSGRLIFPFLYAYSAVGSFAVSTIHSDDDGATWTKSSSELTLPSAGYEAGLSETSLIELQDGTLRVFMRQQRPDKFHLATSSSSDDGDSWGAVSDSSDLSSNTLSVMERTANDDILLLWAGHNAMGGTSAYRNNLTLARSTDETETWTRHLDIFARTGESGPGWYGNEYVKGTQPDFEIVNADAAVFTTSQSNAAVLIEDFPLYLDRTQGAFDDFEYAGVAPSPDNGTQLATQQWWRASFTGEVLTSTNRAQQGSRSLRVRDVSGSSRTIASRIFPSARKGRLTISVNYASAANGIYLDLQEGYSDHSNAVATAFLLMIDSSGELKHASPSFASTPRRVGWTPGDSDPINTVLSHFGGYGGTAFDYDNRSVGMDLRTPKTVQTIKLFDSDSTSRVTGSDVKVYKSDTNEPGDWVEVTGWTFAKSGGVITISGLNDLTRYIKVNSLHSDENFTFGNDMQRLMDVTYAEADPVVSYSSLSTPVVLSADTWYEIIVHYDLDAGTAAVIVDGVQKGVIAQAHDAATVSHLQLSTGTGTGTDVYVDKVIVQDYTLALPELYSLGSVQTV